MESEMVRRSVEQLVIENAAITYATWENDRYSFKFSRINGKGFVTCISKPSNKLVDTCSCSELNVAYNMAEDLWPGAQIA